MYFKAVSKWKLPSRGYKYRMLIVTAENDNNLPHNLLARLLQQESHYDELAHNKSSDAQGIAQIVPRWHPTVNNPFNPNEAIPYAAQYLKKLYDYFGHWDLALASYNWGRGNVSNLIDYHGVNGFEHMPRETKNYVMEILKDVKTV